MKRFLYLFLTSLLLLTSCDTRVSTTPAVTYKPAPTNIITRFEIQSQGIFKAGYANSERELFLIKDTKTGVEYLGITDASLIKLKQVERTDAALDVLETAIDVASEIAGE